MRGGKRQGAGGKKPKLPSTMKRVKGTITLLPSDWEWLRSFDESQSKIVEKAIKLYRERLSL